MHQRIYFLLWLRRFSMFTGILSNTYRCTIDNIRWDGSHPGIVTALLLTACICFERYQVWKSSTGDRSWIHLKNSYSGHCIHQSRPWRELASPMETLSCTIFTWESERCRFGSHFRHAICLQQINCILQGVLSPFCTHHVYSLDHFINGSFSAEFLLVLERQSFNDQSLSLKNACLNCGLQKAKDILINTAKHLTSPNATSVCSVTGLLIKTKPTRGNDT